MLPPRIDLKVNSENPDDDLREILLHVLPGMPDDPNFQLTPMTGGLVNKTYRAKSKENDILLRIHVDSTSEMFDRKQEIAYLLFLQSHGFYPRIHGIFQNGLCYDYLPGRCLSPSEMLEEKFLRKVATKMAELHVASIEYEPKTPKDLQRVIDELLSSFIASAPDMIKEEAEYHFGSISSLIADWKNFCKEMEPTPEVQGNVLCHSDIHPLNIIYNEQTDGLHFIDWEFAGFSRFETDIAGVFAECLGLKDKVDLSLEFVRYYLERKAELLESELVGACGVWNTYIVARRLALFRAWYCVAFLCKANVSAAEKSERDDRWCYAKAALDQYFTEKKLVMSLPFMEAGGRLLGFSIDSENPILGLQYIFSQLRPDLHFLTSGHAPQIKSLPGGNVNQIFLLSTSERPRECVLVRVHLDVMQGVFDREKEYRYLQHLAQCGLAAEVYGRFNNGVCCAFVEGRTLELHEFREQRFSRMVAEKLAELHFHTLAIAKGQSPEIVSKARRYIGDSCWTFVDPVAQSKYEMLFPERKSLGEELERCVALYEKMQDEFPVVLCHNDLLPSNMIYDEEKDELTLIDFEFATIEISADDIGNFFSEFVGMDPEKMDYNQLPSDEFRLDFIRTYLRHWKALRNESVEVTDGDVRKLCVQANRSILVKLLFLIGFVFNYEQHNTDYTGLAKKLGWDSFSYARKALDGYFMLRDKIIALELDG